LLDQTLGRTTAAWAILQEVELGVLAPLLPLVEEGRPVATGAAELGAGSDRDLGLGPTALNVAIGLCPPRSTRMRPETSAHRKHLTSASRKVRTDAVISVPPSYRSQITM